MRISEKYFIFRMNRNLKRKLKKIKNEHFEETIKLIEAEKGVPNEPALNKAQNNHDKKISKIEDYRHDLFSTILLRKADNYNIPHPKGADCWKSDKQRFLSKKGLYKVNKLVRQEVKERREIWIPIISVLIGLMGTIIALISILIN
jgi:hypothetical protein